MDAEAKLNQLKDLFLVSRESGAELEFCSPLTFHMDGSYSFEVGTASERWRHTVRTEEIVPDEG
jgi:hypothetical protein